MFFFQNESDNLDSMTENQHNLAISHFGVKKPWYKNAYTYKKIWQRNSIYQILKSYYDNKWHAFYLKQILWFWKFKDGLILS